MINVEIEKTGNESNANVLRRFTKQVQSAKVLSVARSKRYSERKLSHFKKKAQALASMKRRENVQELIKLGKITPRKYR